MCEIFEKKKTNRHVSLMMELLKSKVEDENRIRAYLNKITDLRNRLDELKSNSIDDTLLFAIIMSKLLNAFGTFQTIYVKDEVIEGESFESLENLIQIRKVKLKHHGMLVGSSLNQALVMKTQRKIDI